MDDERRVQSKHQFEHKWIAWEQFSFSYKAEQFASVQEMLFFSKTVYAT